MWCSLEFWIAFLLYSSFWVGFGGGGLWVFVTVFAGYHIQNFPNLHRYDWIGTLGSKSKTKTTLIVKGPRVDTGVESVLLNDGGLVVATTWSTAYEHK